MKKLIKLIIILVLLTQSAGQSYALRPAATASVTDKPKYCLQNIKVGITGATGCLGAPFVRWLLGRPIKINAITRSVDSQRARGRIPLSDNVSFRESDLFNLDKLNWLTEGSDVVYHIGGWARVEPTPSDAEAFALNCLSTAIVMELAKKHGKRLVFTSSGAVYLNTLDKKGVDTDKLKLDKKTEAFVEKIVSAFRDYAAIITGNTQDWPAFNESVAIGFVETFLQTNQDLIPEIQDFYGLTKIIAERLVLEHENSVVLRIWHVYGRGDETQRRIPTLFKKLTTGFTEPLVINRERIAFTYIDRVLFALEAAALYPLRPNNRTINVASSVLYDTVEAAYIIKDITGSKRPIIVSSEPGIMELHLDNRLSTVELGLPPEKPFEERILETHRWYAENERWSDQNPLFQYPQPVLLETGGNVVILAVQ